MVKSFNIHPQELESVYDLTHAQPRHVKKLRAQERFKQRLARQKEKVAWVKDTDVYKYANDGTKAVLVAYVSSWDRIDRRPHTHTDASTYAST